MPSKHLEKKISLHLRCPEIFHKNTITVAHSLNQLIGHQVRKGKTNHQVRKKQYITINTLSSDSFSFLHQERKMREGKVETVNVTLQMAVTVANTGLY